MNDSDSTLKGGEDEIRCPSSNTETRKRHRLLSPLPSFLVKPPVAHITPSHQPTEQFHCPKQMFHGLSILSPFPEVLITKEFFAVYMVFSFRDYH